MKINSSLHENNSQQQGFYNKERSQPTDNKAITRTQNITQRISPHAL